MVTVLPADHEACLPDSNAVEAKALGDLDEIEEEYIDLVCAIDNLKRTPHEVTMFGSPTLHNPDKRESFEDPNEWMLLLEFDGKCSWLAGVAAPRKFQQRPSFNDVDYLQYFVRKSDYHAGRLDRGCLQSMMT